MGLYVVSDRQSQRNSYFQLQLIRKVFICLFWCEHHTKSLARVNPQYRKLGSLKTMDDGQSSKRHEAVKPRVQSRSAKTWSREGCRAVRGQHRVRIARLSSEDDLQRWPSIFGSCVGFSLTYCDCHEYISTEYKKNSTDLTDFYLAALNKCLVCSPFLCFFVVFFYSLLSLWNAHSAGFKKK